MNFAIYREQYRANIKLALPVVLTQLGQIIVQLADNIMVGQYGGDNAVPLAAVSFGNSIFFLFFIAAIGISFGLTPLIGELYAQGQREESGRLFRSGLTLYLLIGLVTSLLLHLSEPLLYYMGQPTEVVDMAIPYYRYMTLSMPFVMLFFSLKQFLEGLGNTQIVMSATIICNALNILLNWIFIYGECGSPEMGAEGAGLATFISRAIVPFIIFGYMLSRTKYRYYFSGYRLWSWPKDDFSTLLKMGLPISAQVFLESAAFVGTGIMMGWLGTIEISANQIATTMANCAFNIVMSIGAAATILASHGYGERNIEKIKLVKNSSYHLALAWNAIMAILFIVLRYHIARIFTSNAEVIELTAELMIFVALFQLSDGLQNVSVGILRALQDVKIIMPIAFIAYIALNLPIGYLLSFNLGMGAKGMILSYTIGLSMAAILMILRIRRRIKHLSAEFTH